MSKWNNATITSTLHVCTQTEPGKDNLLMFTLARGAGCWLTATNSIQKRRGYSLGSAPLVWNTPCWYIPASAWQNGVQGDVVLGYCVWTVDLPVWSGKWVPSLRTYDMQTWGSGIWNTPSPVGSPYPKRKDRHLTTIENALFVSKIHCWNDYSDSPADYSGQDRRVSVKLHLNGASSEESHPLNQSILYMCAVLDC